RHPGAPARRRSRYRARRFRQRLLLARLRAPLPAADGQDRPQVRLAFRHRRFRARPGRARRACGPGALARHRGPGRRRGDGSTTSDAAVDGLPARPGFPVRPGAAVARMSAGDIRAGSIRVGIGGWTYAPWRNNFYPPGLVQRRELEYASRRVTAIEVNGTYYGTQQP